MKTRGEKRYIHLPIFAARLYDHLTRIKGVNQSFEEISAFVDDHVKQGRLLNIGTGPGRLLCKIHKNTPGLDLFGLDISASMLRIAKENLKNLENLDLRLGNISQTDYPDDYFDVIISSGSFYNWDKPVDGLNEIYRILKPRQSAYIFETHKDFNKKELNYKLKENLIEYNFIRKFLSKIFFRKQLAMTYSLNEFGQILKQSKFKNNFKIQKSELGNLPVYVRLELNKLSENETTDN